MTRVVLTAVALLMSGCAEPERVSAVDFQKQYLDVGVMHSMRHVTFLGVRGERAYINVSSMRVVGGGWKERVIFVPLVELDEAFRGELLKKPTFGIVTPRAAASAEVGRPENHESPLCLPSLIVETLT
jgi:hypothetical protein